MYQRGTLLPASRQGRQLAFDYKYIVPWGDFVDPVVAALSTAGALGRYVRADGEAEAEDAAVDVRQNVGEFAEAASDFIGGKLGTPWWALLNIKFNRDPFTGDEIYSEYDAPMDKAVKSMNYLYRFMVPAWTPAPEAVIGTTPLQGGYTYERMKDYAEGATDSQGKLKQPSLFFLVLDTAAGLRLREIDPEMQRVWAIGREDRVVREQQRVMRDADRKLQRNEITEQQYLSIYEGVRRNIDRAEARIRRQSRKDFGETR